MAWTATHIGTVATVDANVITPGCTSTTAGNTLIAALVAQAGTIVWTLPAGWAKAVQESPGSAVTTAVYYYLNNPGGITSVQCNASVTNNLTALIAEFSPGSATAAINATGVNNAGSATTLTVTTSTNAAAGDLGICCFGTSLSPSTAATWTQPASWTTMGATTGNIAVHAYSAYDLSAPGGAALAVQGHISVTQTTFAGACCTFSLISPPATTAAIGNPGIIPVLKAAGLI